MKNESIFKNKDITNNDNINENDEIISNRYKIIHYLGGGASGKVYLATKIYDSNEKYAVKVLNKKKDYFMKIIKYVIKIISDLDSPYIIKMKDYGKGKIKLRGEEPKDIQYIAYEYASNGTLLHYLLEPYSFFEEKYAKIIFKNIARGIQEMHNNNICHRDIKLENILLGPNFTPKICDFGFSRPINKKLLISLAGTEGYAAPEIMKIKKIKDGEKMNKIKDNNKHNNEDKKNENNNKEKIGYDGKKADIFSLGVCLLELVTGEIYENLYIYAEKDELNRFFEEEVKKHLSDKVKELIKNMINYNPEERPDINKILTNEWLSDINENDIDIMKDYFIELNKRKNEIERQNKDRTININQNKIIEIYSSKESHIKRYIPYFEKNYNLEYIDDNQIPIKDFIQINNLLDPLEYMNLIANKIREEMNNREIKGNEIWEYNIKEDNNYFKFEISLENEEEGYEEKSENEEKEEEDEEEEKEEEKEEDFIVKSEEQLEEYENSNYYFKKFIKNKILKIEVKLLQSINGYHLLIFNKISGDIRKYNENISKIISIIKNN